MRRLLILSMLVLMSCGKGLESPGQEQVDKVPQNQSLECSYNYDTQKIVCDGYAMTCQMQYNAQTLYCSLKGE